MAEGLKSKRKQQRIKRKEKKKEPRKIPRRCTPSYDLPVLMGIISHYGLHSTIT